MNDLESQPTAVSSSRFALIARAFLVAASLCVLLLGVALAAADPAYALQEETQEAAQQSERDLALDAEAERASEWVEQFLPDYFVEMIFLDLALWQWMALLALVIVASFLGLIASFAVVRVVSFLLRRIKAEWPKRVLQAVAGPLRLFLSVWLFYIGSVVILGLDSRALEFIGTTVEVLGVIAATWLALRLVDVGAGLTREHFVARGVPAALTLVPMGVRITKVFVVLIALLSLVHNLGFNVASLLAGLGVGGLAVALALQKPLENLFSGITVIMDQPVKVGDFCRVGEHIGTVEDIGLRATRIRTLDRTLLSIANSEFASARIESFTARDKIRFAPTLSFGYDTSPDQMRFILTRIREILNAHPKVDPDPARVRWTKYGAYSLDVDIFAFVRTTDFNEYLGVQEDLFLHIYEAVQESGAYFAFPTQTLYLGRDAGRDAERTQATEELVQQWREAGKLPFPSLPKERIAEVDDTLPWPPKGAPPLPDPATQAPAPEAAKPKDGRKGWFR